jgi:GT2 family glycosyltransferase
VDADRRDSGITGSLDAPRPDVSVAIVHFETPGYLVRSLKALSASIGAEALEVFVVDNASRSFNAADASDAFPGIRIICNRTNVGFARATNQALRQARGRFVLLLNPDAFVAPESIALMTAYLDAHPAVGCVTCRLELENGRLDLACRRLFPTPSRSLYRMTLLSRIFPRNRRFGQYNLTYLSEWETTEIDQPCGAFMLVRAEILDEVGYLDERYFLFGEDTDWAYRIKKAGWQIWYVPTTTVRHIKRASTRKNRQQTIRYFYQSMRIFYRQHYEPVYPRWLNATILLVTHIREQIELTAESLLRLRSRLSGCLRRGA